MLEVKQQLDLSSLPETKLPFKDLDQYIDKDSKGVAFEDGADLMTIVLKSNKLMKKRVSKKNFKMDDS